MIKVLVVIFLSYVSSFIVQISSTINIEKPIMELTIPSINFKGSIYDKTSKLNDIDKNIVIMNDSDLPDQENSIVIIGGHSGIGKYAYFKRLNLVKLNDEIIISYKNKKYYYKVSNIYLDKKDGSIRITNPSLNTLVIYTCNPNDKDNYLVLISTLKEKK